MNPPDQQAAALATAARAIAVGRDALGNTILTGDGNVVIVQQLQPTREPEVETPIPSPRIGANPYKGLEAFQEEDANRFFGREKLVATLWERFRDLHAPPPPGQVRHRVLPVVGPSGSGKSSLVRAGLVPELARRPLPALRGPRVAVLTPGSDPCHALGTVLARIATGDATPAAKAREFAGELRFANAAGAHDGLRRLADLLPGIERSPLVVLVDQFEEIYSLCKDDAAQDAFVGALLDAAGDPTGRVSVVLTLRSDFLGATARHPALNQLVAGEGVLVPAMDEAGLRRAISEPARLAGHPLDEGTVELLVRETVGREGALPLLQFVLTRIWEGLGRNPARAAADTLRELGGVGGALASEADRLLAELAGQGLEPIARRSFLAMVQLGEGARDTRRRARLREVVAAGETPEAVLEVLRRFARPGERLVTLTGEGAEVQVEVTHEQLIERWPKLREWLDEGRDDIRFHRRLAEAAAEWKAKRGGLWRPPELDLLRAYRASNETELTADEVSFANASVRDWQDQLDRAKRTQDRLNWFTRLLTGFVVVLGCIASVAILLAIGFMGASEQARIRSLLAEAAATEAAHQTARAQAYVARIENDNKRYYEAAIAALAGLAEPLELDADSTQLELLSELLRAASADNFLVPPLQHQGLINDAAFDANGKWIVTASDDASARIWDAKTGKQIVQPIRHVNAVKKASFDPSGEQIITVALSELFWDFDARIGEWGFRQPRSRIRQVWDVHTGKPVSTPNEQQGLMPEMLTELNSERVVAVSGDKAVSVLGNIARVRDVRTSESVDKTLPHTGPVKMASFDLSGARIVTVSGNMCQVWNVRTGEPLGKPMPLDNDTIDIAFSPNGEEIIAVSGNTVRVWNARTGDQIGEPIRHEDWIQFASLGKNRQLVLTDSYQQGMQAWDARTKEQIGEELEHLSAVTAIGSDASGDRIAIASWDQEAADRDARSMDKLVVPLRYTDHRTDKGALLIRNVQTEKSSESVVAGHSVEAISFDQDGKTAVTISIDKVQVWDVDTGEQFGKELRHQAYDINAASLDPSGDRVITASADNTAQIWDARTGEPLGKPLKHEGPVTIASFDPSGDRVITASADNTARIWDARTGEPLGKPLKHQSPVTIASFDPSGDRVVTASAENVARIWIAPQTGQKFIDEVRRKLGERAPAPLKLSSNYSQSQGFIISIKNGFALVWERIKMAVLGPISLT